MEESWSRENLFHSCRRGVFGSSGPALLDELRCRHTGDQSLNDNKETENREVTLSVMVMIIVIFTVMNKLLQILQLRAQLDGRISPK